MDPAFFSKSLTYCSSRIVGLDPGETTGACGFVGSALVSIKQIKGMTVPEVFNGVRAFICENNPDVIVMEDYKVYSWKTQDHAWGDLFTARLIGAVECYCADKNIKLVKQMAQQAKGFCTDDKLKVWNLWSSGRHARDAVRHAVYYLLFEVAKIHKPATPS